MSISHPAASELKQLLGSVTAGGLIPELLRQGLKPLIEAEAATAPGAYRHQRTDQRRGHRNGSRDRLLTTPAGEIWLRIPRLRTEAASRRCWSLAASGSGPLGRRDGGLRLRRLLQQNG
jgi:hypothetical protein